MENEVKIENEKGTTESQSNRMNFSFEDEKEGWGRRGIMVKKLLQEVKSRPFLYDSSHPDYRNRSKINKEWSILSANMGTSASYIKKRWRNLRDSFLKTETHKRIQRLEPKSTRFYLYDEMVFILPHKHASVRDFSNDGKEEYDGSYVNNNKTEIEMEGNSVEDENFASSYTLSPSPEVSSIPSPEVSSIPSAEVSSHNSSASTSALTATIINNQSDNKSSSEQTDREFEEDTETSCYHCPSSSDCSELNFFQGLVPMIKDLSKRRKCLFYSEVAHLLYTHLDQQEDDEL